MNTDHIALIIYCSVMVAVVVLRLIVLLFEVRAGTLEKMQKVNDNHLLLQQIIEDADWDFWIELEARKVNDLFAGDTTYYKVTLPKDYKIFHKSGKYVNKQISEGVFERFREIQEGAGRNLILS